MALSVRLGGGFPVLWVFVVRRVLVVSVLVCVFSVFVVTALVVVWVWVCLPRVFPCVCVCVCVCCVGRLWPPVLASPGWGLLLV